MHASLRKICWSLSLFVVPVAVEAQFISLKTVPIASGEQFLIFPTSNLGMAGVTLALDDAMLDPWVNPAKGARVSATRVHGTPTFYSFNDDQGGARTLPGSVLLTTGRTFGGLTAAIQQFDHGNRGSVDLMTPGIDQGVLLRERTSTNEYGAVTLGRRFGGGNAIGVSFAYSDLEAVDGVDRLYAGSRSIQQGGQVRDFRLGYLKEMDGDRALEAVLLHARTRMKHEVTYVDFVWDPVERRNAPSPRVESNLDRSNTYGAHVAYSRPLNDKGWRTGGAFTVNYKNHPKIPNYEIVNVPRDPGHSWAYSIGVGVSRKLGKLQYGGDLLYEPIWSKTWADAGATVQTRSGGTIRPGERTVDNEFVFSNKTLRLGVGEEGELFGWQAGLHIKRIRYTLQQTNYILETQRDQDEGWSEVSPTWSAVLKFPEFLIRYSGYVTTNGINFAFGEPRSEVIVEPAPGGVDFVAAPSRPIDMGDFSVLVHQLSISIPLKRKASVSN